MEFSPSAERSIAARSDRPTSREISCVRPPILPRTDSRSLRVVVARGSIAYSAVTQPRPESRRQRGTEVCTVAAHSTRVPPNATRTEPSAWVSHPRRMVTGRSWSAERSSGRAMEPTLSSPADTRSQVVHGPLDRQLDVAAVAAPLRLGEAVAVVVPGHEVSEHEPLRPGPRGVLTRLARGQVQAGRQARPFDEGRLGQQQVGAAGQVGERLALAGVAGV